MVQAFRIAFASAFVLPFANAALKDGGFFRYFDANEAGAWSKSDKTSILDPWVKDAQDLILAGLTAVQSYTTSEDARRQLMAFYALQPAPGANPESKEPKSKDRIHALLGETNAWINGNPPVLPEDQKMKPIIFNGDGWGEEKAWTDTAFDNQGKPLNGDKKIQDMYKAQFDKRKQKNLVPYWAKDFNDYFFDRSHGDKGACSDEGVFAVTNDQIEEAMIVTLCVKNIQRRFPQTLLPKADSVPWNVGRKTATQLDSLSPQALTLLHEFFHVVDFTGTPDVLKSASASTAISNAAGKTKPTNINEAEVYAYFCLASYYNQKKVTVQDKKKTVGDVNLVFVSGFAELP